MRTPATGLLLIAVLAAPVQAGHKFFVNARSVAHKGSGGMSVVFPDVCKTPPSPPGGLVPLPYPNTTMSSDLGKGTKKTKAGGAIRVTRKVVRTGGGSAEVYAFKLVDSAGKRVPIRQSILIELKDGTFCGVCVDDGRITALLELYKTPPLQLEPIRPKSDLKPPDPQARPRSSDDRISL